MATCGSFQCIFEKPLPENPTLLESLSSWNQINKPIDDSPSFTEIFGELHFKESSVSSSSSPLPLSSSSSSLSSSSSSIFSYPQNNNRKQYVGSHKNSDSFSSMNSESLQLCTEGLGFESSDDVEDLVSNVNNDSQNQERIISIAKHTNSTITPHENLYGELRRSRSSSGGGGTFPPPISCIGKSGKPWVSFKSYRHDGRFVLKEIRIPTQEFLHAYREDGRLKLHFVQSDDEILEEEDEDEEKGDDENENGEEEENDDEKNVEIIKNDDHGGDS
uniref:FAF domain-containing protein n=1 Tax=Davidia involucrata TaxID=16924 RepID=A0A5B7BGR5_DAVIN